MYSFDVETEDLSWAVYFYVYNIPIFYSNEELTWKCFFFLLVIKFYFAKVEKKKQWAICIGFSYF